MAAESEKISVENQQVVLRIHQKIKIEVRKIAQGKSWDDNTKKQFEGKLLKLYKDTVQESVNRNVRIQSKTEHTQGEEIAASQAKKDAEKKRRFEVAEMWTQLEDLIRETTRKRKEYPPQIVEAIRSVLKCKVADAESYSPSIRSDPVQPSSSTSSNEDERLQEAVKELSALSKGFPDLKDKLDRLQGAMLSYKAMETRETDAVLFNEETPLKKRKRPSETPQNVAKSSYSLRSAEKSRGKIQDVISRRSLSSQFKRKRK